MQLMNEVGTISITLYSKDSKDILAIQKALAMTNLEFTVG